MAGLVVIFLARWLCHLVALYHLATRVNQWWWIWNPLVSSATFDVHNNDSVERLDIRVSQCLISCFMRCCIFYPLFWSDGLCGPYLHDITNGCRFNCGTTGCKGRSKFECHFDCLPHRLRGVLPLGQGNSTFSKYNRQSLLHPVFIFLSFYLLNLAQMWYLNVQETMSNEHAMRFPLVGSAMLLSLFLLFKFVSKDLVNAVLTCYFFVLGIVALSYVLPVWAILLSIICCKFSAMCLSALLTSFFFLLWQFSRATLLPAIRRFLPNHWNEDLIVWRFPYFRCMWPPRFPSFCLY